MRLSDWCDVCSSDLNRESVPHLRALTDAVHREGAAICAQITHGGAFTFVPELSTRYPRSASGGFNAAGVLRGRLFRTAMTDAEMGAVIGGFAAGAHLARAAGFDSVGFPMGQRYLLTQLLSPLYN